jgi:hypothetical protein
MEEVASSNDSTVQTERPFVVSPLGSGDAAPLEVIFSTTSHEPEKHGGEDRVIDVGAVMFFGEQPAVAVVPVARLIQVIDQEVVQFRPGIALVVLGLVSMVMVLCKVTAGA